jgi:lipopolysaccharide transport system ATP-binding protein
MRPILEVQNIGKRFRIRHKSSGYLTLRERLLTAIKQDGDVSEDFWALNDVSFEIGRGESLGIIGRNGAGKSTLLKILSKITPPSKGKIISRGRIASLLEVGTGFHPELSGRENIFFNGSLLGMRKREIESKFDEIVDFSGVEKFLDTPLKHYSSGMQLRLAFAVAAFLEPEILIIDEVLAVGDAEFQAKCIGKMEDVSRSGRTILFVSHNLPAVANLCNRGLLLNAGRIAAIGPIADVLDTYQGMSGAKSSSEWRAAAASKGPVSLKQASVQLKGLQPHHSIEVTATISSAAQHKDAFLAFDVSNSRGLTVLQAIPNFEPFIKYSQHEQHFRTIIELPPLIPDHYRVSVWMGPHNTETFFWEKEIIGFEINQSPMPGRNFPHSHNNGFLVSPSRLLYD